MNDHKSMNEVTETPRILGMISAFVTNVCYCLLLANYDFTPIRMLYGCSLPLIVPKSFSHTSFKTAYKNRVTF